MATVAPPAAKRVITFTRPKFMNTDTPLAPDNILLSVRQIKIKEISADMCSEMNADGITHLEREICILSTTIKPGI